VPKFNSTGKKKMSEKHSSTNNTYVIAEMAYSHDGSVELATEICEKAARAGADAISIHITSMPDYMVRHYGAGPGRVSAGKDTKPIYDYLVEISLSFDEWAQVANTAKQLGLDIVIMPNDAASFKFATSLAPSAFVLSAACFEEYDFITDVGRAGLPVYLRVGGATLGEIETVITLLEDSGCPNIILLYGHQNYPTGVEETNLNYLPLLSSTFGKPVGLADHIDADDEFCTVLPAMAIAMGVRYIEKHITHDRAKRGEDFESALNEDEFKLMMQRIRKADAALGQNNLSRLADASVAYRANVRKRIVAVRDIASGETITRDSLGCKRSDEGLSPAQIDLVIGRRASQDIPFDCGIELELLGGPNH
jgi:N,N'-diacetyllegionaminate synthase